MNTPLRTVYCTPLLLFGCLFVLSILVSCKKDRVQKADLLFDFAEIGQDSVGVGFPLVLESAIANTEAVCEDCVTETANPSDRSIRVQYRPDENSPWVDAQLKDQDGNISYELVVPVPEIKAGKKHIKSEGFQFAVPGIYRYILDADVMEIVIERIETNNDADSNDGLVRSSSNPKFRLLVVVTDPSKLTKPVFDPAQRILVSYLGAY